MPCLPRRSPAVAATRISRFRNRRRHTHFPPGYPAALAVVWSITGRSLAAAHLFSCACTLAATVAAWWWFRGMYPPRAALFLGLALAVNWAWARNGGAILSEPLFLLLGQLALLAIVHVEGRGGIVPGIMLGALLAACVLTRHVGIAIAGGAAIELLLRRHRPTAFAAALTFGLLLLPWVAWLALAGAPNSGKPACLRRSWESCRRITTLAIFYLQRMPDQLTGPIVEIGTVFQHRPWIQGGRQYLGDARDRRSGCWVVADAADSPSPDRRAHRVRDPDDPDGVALHRGRPVPHPDWCPCLLAGAVEGLTAIIARCNLRRPRELGGRRRPCDLAPVRDLRHRVRPRLPPSGGRIVTLMPPAPWIAREARIARADPGSPPRRSVLAHRPPVIFAVVQ